ncbi:MAG: family 16 glycoside hydrolase [Chitinophagaceae bacterium]
MRLKISCLSLLLLFILFSADAQKVKPRFKELSLSSLESFDNPSSNWKIIGAVQSSFSDTSLNIARGQGILFNDFSHAIKYKPGHHLTTKLQHGDIVLDFDFMIPKGANSGIYLQSRYEVQINDSWGVKLPTFSDVGGIYERWENEKGYEGSAPLTNAGLAPGLWQHMEISFQAPRFDGSGKKITNAKFNYVRLNGVTIHENIIVSGPTRSPAFENETAMGPLMIQGDHGQIAFKNFKYAPQDELNVTLSDINYSYFEKSAKTPDEATKTKPTSFGKIKSLDGRLASARDQFYLQFEGKINVPSKETYTFSMLHTGDGSLEIDGKKVIEPRWTWIGADPLTGNIDLDAGSHQFKIWISKDVNWAPPGFSLYVEKPNSRAVALHAPASMPDRTPAPLVEVKAIGNPEIIRSFMYHNNKKLTHVLSVGDPTQLHYAYDLLQGAMLKIWKGNFLNATDMWYERGEPQTASPLGASIDLVGNCPVYERTATKDSIAAYQYKGYDISGKGHPTFKYNYKNLKIEDQITPNENGRGLSRTIQVEGDGKEKTLIRIAQGSNITPLGNGVYAIDDQKYFIQVGTSVLPNIETYLGQRVLILSAKEKIQYQLIW